MTIWTFINPNNVNPNIFGFSELFAVKVKKFTQDYDVRLFSLKGWMTIADFTTLDPRTGNKLKTPEWFIYAGKGR